MERVRPNETPEEREERKFQEKARSLKGHALIAHHLNGLRLAIREQIKWTAAIDTDLKAGLATIALAASTPEDNSAAVQAQIDKHASEISAVRQTLQSSIDRNQPEGE